MSAPVIAPFVGDLLFPNLDYIAFKDALDALATTDEKIEHISKNYPGLPSVALMVSFDGRDALLKEIQEVNGQILGHRSARRVPGANHRIAYQPQIAHRTLDQAILANSLVLSPNIVGEIRDSTNPLTGGKCYIIVEPRFTSEGQALSVHVEAVFVSDDGRSKPWFIYSASDPKALGFNQQILNEAIPALYGHRDLTHPSPRLPEGPFELMLSATPPDTRLGHANVIESGSLAEGSLLFDNLLARCSGTPDKVTFNTMGVIEISLAKEDWKQALIVSEIIKKSHALGNVTSVGSHCAVNSCGHVTMGLFTLGDNAVVAGDRASPLDQILYTLIDKANSVYWTDRTGMRVLDFMDKFGVIKEDGIPKVSKDVMKTALVNIFSHPTLRTSLNPARASYASQYLVFDRLPDAAGAREAFKAVAEIHLAGLRQILEEKD